MSTSEIENTNRIVAFRCPPVLASAMQAAAAKQFCSVSDVARQAVLKEMRERGLMAEAEMKTRSRRNDSLTA